MIYQNTLLSLSLLAGIVTAQDFGVNCKLDCPANWSSSSCNSDSPNFCCPGSVLVVQGSSSCCVGGIFIANSCSGGALVTVGSDLAAYSSSASAALASVSGTASSDGLATVITSSPVSMNPITFDTIVVGSRTVAEGTTFGGTSATPAPNSNEASGSPSTGAAMPARTAGAQLAGIIAGAGLFLI